MSTEARTTKRSYNSARRAQQAAQTRADVVAAAITLFGEQGWAGTTLAAIAEAAGVSVETIRNGFGSKKGLLRVAMDVAVAGDAEEVPLAERAVFRSLGEGRLDERVQRVAELAIAIQERSSGVWQAIVEAAGGDEEVDAWRLEMEAGRRIDVGRGLALVLGRDPDDRLVTVMWLMLGPEAYRKLVVDQGMSRDDYCELVADLVLRLSG
ncbi:MAG: TetR/AcrR family transcriptional regulator [Acidimicrobiia bacterium]